MADIIDFKRAAEEKREINKKTWQWRVLEHARGNQSMIGSIIIAAMGKSGVVPSQKNIFTSLARIDLDGVIHANFIDKYGVLQLDMAVIRTTTLSEVLTRLATECKLNDEEAKQLFTTVRQWIEKDERAKSEQ